MGTGAASSSSVPTLRSSSCPPQRVPTLELSERQVTLLALPQVPTPATGAHGRGSSSPHRGPQGYQRARRLQQVGQRELGGWGQLDRRGRRREHWTTEPGRERQRERDMQRQRRRDGDPEKDAETEMQKKTETQRQTGGER